MKKSSRRALSRIMASVMLISSMLTNVAYASDMTAEEILESSTSVVDEVTSGGATEDTVVTEPVAGEDYFFDFTDGSIIPTDTDGKTDIDKGIIKVLVGSQNAYGYNGAQHGSILKAGNTIELKVAGSGTVKIGGCAYSGTGDITVSSADGSYSDTRTVEKGSVGCYHNDGSTIDFVYNGGATTLTIAFTTVTYVPCISFVAQKSGIEVTEPEKNVSYFFDFTDGSIVPADTSLNGTATIEAGLIKVECGPSNGYGYNGAQHGSIFKDGNVMSLKVAGNSLIKFGGCQYSSGTITGATTVGQFENDVIDSKTAACYHNDSTATADFLYVGDADTLTFTFGSPVSYIPNVQIVPVPYEVDLVPWVQKNFSLDINGTTVSVTGAATSSEKSSVTLSDAAAEVGVVGTTDASLRLNLGGQTLSDALISNVTEGYSAAVVDGKIVVTLADASSKPYEYVISVADNSVVVKAEAGELYNYTFNNGSVVPQDTSIKYTKFVSEDGILTMNSPASYLYYHDASHGLAATVGDSFDMIVAGNAIITFATCQYTAEGYYFEFTDASGNVLGTTSATNIDIGACGSNTFAYAGGEGTITATIKHATATGGEVYIHGLSIANEAEIVKSDKIEVWDFGGAELDTEIYNNNLTVDIINSFYDSSITVGSTGNVAPTSFSAGALSWVGGANDRIRTTNTAITRYDENVAVTTIGDAEVSGRLYVNAAANTGRALSIACAADDIVTVYGKTDSGGKLNFVYVADPSVQTDVVDFSSDAAVYTFHAKADGTYKFYDTAGKPSYYRITKKGAEYATVSGSVTVPEAMPEGYGIVATNVTTGKVFAATVANGSYTVDLPTNFEYKFSLTDANGFVIESGAVVSVGAAEAIDNAITVVQVPLFTLSGNVTGLPSLEALTVDLVATSETAVYVPEVTINADGTYTAQLEEGMEYTVVANGVNDYTVAPATVKITEDTTMDLAFSAKPVYPVTIDVVGEDIDDATLEAVKASLALTFTNLNEDGYVYTFAAGETPQLRTGVYTVKVAGYNLFAVTPALISNVKVEDAATTKTIKFRAVNSWGFVDLNEVIASEGAHEGLLISGSAKTETGKSHLATGAGAEIKVPVLAGQTVNIGYYYRADFTVDGAEAVTGYSSGSTSIYDSYVATATADGYMTIAPTNTTYFTSISIGGTVEYKPQITVGADKEYQTINAALDAINEMSRPNNERVEVLIDPGNYEEMLVVTAPNVSLINAAGANASIALANKGVDIDENAVRITSYYGHGYNYYSMTTDCKYDEEVLQVNKENGYLSFENPGSGTTKNSYWNATVTIRGEGFVADNIIFENSFNQYISQKEANDVVVAWESGSKGIRPTTYGDTSVQKKSFVERASAIAILADKGIYNNCRFVGHQDTLYGAANCRAYFKDGVAMGGCDYIFGAFIAVFDGTDLMITTSDDSSDVSYITAAQQSSGRGYLMYNCTITSTTPGVETASTYRAKALKNYLGRPWQATTSETVFYNTTIETGYTPVNGTLGDVDGNGVINANDSAVTLQYVLNPTFTNYEKYNFAVADVDGITGVEASDAALILQKALRSTTSFVEPVGNSLINGVGWLATLGGEAPTYEYGTIELGNTDGIARADWSTVLTEPVLPDGTEIKIENWLGDWDYTADMPTTPDTPDVPVVPPVELDPVTVYVVGDSTGCDYAATADSTYYYKRVGFGTRLGDYLDDKATVVNYALSGRSSKSFLSEANYKSLLNNMKEGDYLFIAFGHNDEKADDATRYTEPLGDKDTEGSFKNSLYVNYIQPALAVGATPILCTPVVRRTESGSWSNSCLHVANGYSYADCVRELGAELGLTVVDNTADTQALYDELTPAGSVELHAWLSSKSTSVDNTHLNNYGAAYVAYLMASSVKNSTNPLSAYVGDITAPDKATNLIVNPDYVEASTDDVDRSELVSKYWTTTSPWYATAFGDIGGQSKLNTVTYAEDGVTVVSDELTVNSNFGDVNFAINELADGSVQIRTGDVASNSSYGKIAGTTDAFTLYYQPVDAGSNFEISAVANVNNVLVNSQVSFGAICMDRILVNTNAKETYDYVAAGALKYGDGTAMMTFTRDASTASLSSNVTGASYTPAAGDKVNLKITKVGNKFTVIYGDTTTTYEKEMTGDVYFGFYTTRNADVTFSDIVYNNEVTE